MKIHAALITKIMTIVILSIFMAASCTLQINIPPIKTINASSEKYDASEAYKSVAMVALSPIGRSETLGLGTAFAVNDKTLLTAGHVCSAIQNLKARNIVGPDIYLLYLGRADRLAKRKGAKIKATDMGNDICQLEMPGHGLAPLKFADYKTVKLRDKTYIVGAPAGVMISVTEGEVMSPKTNGLAQPNVNGKLAITSAATGGHSGSPILNNKGEVIGMLVSGHSTYDHLSFGVRGPILKRFMKIFGIGG